MISHNEFHISKVVRDECGFDQAMFASTGNAVFADFKAVLKFQTKLNELFDRRNENEKRVSAGNLNAMGLIDEIFHQVCFMFRRDKAPDAFKNLLEDLDRDFGKDKMDAIFLQFMGEFPPVEVYQEKATAEEYLSRTCFEEVTNRERSNREQTLEEMILLHLANENPAFHPFQVLFNDEKLLLNPDYTKSWIQIKAYFETQPVFGPKNNTLINMLKEPVIASPTSLKGQLDYIRTYWESLLGEWLRRMLEGIDTITEEEKAAWHPTNGGEVEMSAYTYDENLMREYERFSPDREWMPKVVLMAKTVLVWLYQLSKKYNSQITRLDQIPDEELDALRDAGFTGLWLIGLWERSNASKRIKQINGNPEAAASAYSLLDYEIAWNLGGWQALENLRYRCWVRGIRLASDMVPNHTGMDGTWVTEHPNYFITTKDCPFPQYTFTGENLSHDGRVSIYLEDHYFSKTDCAVCYKRVDNATGDVTYIYHGNDGTGMPWNDTAQIDFLNPEAREAVMQQILKVARNFPIIRFDAAMVLAKKHIRRLWYPEPGHGGDIATRSRYALTTDEFESRIPNEFWREVVDRCANEMPDTLLLAEAFWMMEGYFTRTLGMHRVYNSAFMNMLKKEENQKYRDTVKNTIKFDPQVLKRFVNFMNNPDEETAVAQFGKDDKYFGVCTLMITMPGLPMFGHGQLEGYEEKYGMEYTRAYRDESVDENLMNRHRHDIFPLLHKRYLFAPVENFRFYDVWDNGSVNENIFAYSNSVGNERTIVFYNNKYERAQGWIKQSCDYVVKTGSGENDKTMVSQSLSDAMGLTYGYNHYVIFREARSGLWFVRKADDIINSGMFVALNGFESQVYLDVQQVEDNAEGKYAKLHDLLNGRGVEDLEIAWQEYRYKDLYAALKEFISEDYVEKLHGLFAKKAESKSDSLEKAEKTEESKEKTSSAAKKSKEKTPTVKAILKEIKESALAYFEQEAKFAKEAYEEKEQEKAENASSQSKKSLTQKEKRALSKSAMLDAEERFALFSKALTYVHTAYVNARQDDETVAMFSLEKTIFEGLEQIENSEVVLGAFTCVCSAGGENCMKWGLNRKLAEILAERGEKIADARNVFARMFLTMRISSLNFGAGSFPKSTYTAAKFIVESPFAAVLSGANEYNGVKWFNKEKIESTLLFGLTANAVVSQRLVRDHILRLFRTLTAAKELAEYKCDNFVANVTPAEMPDSSKPKKTAKKKTESKAAEPKKTASKKSESEK